MRINNVTNNFYSKANSAPECSGGKFAESLELKKREMDEKNARDSYVSGTGSTQANMPVRFRGTHQERFEQLEKLNAETNWSLLSDAEKVKLMTDRYRAAFKDFDIVMSGLYNTLFIPSYEEIGDHYGQEFDKYLSKDGEAPLQSGIEVGYKEAYYGNLTDDEIRAEIMDKYIDSNTMESKYLMMYEMVRCGFTKNGELDVLYSMDMQIYEQVENANKIALYGTNMSISQHPRFAQMFMEYAKGIGEGKNYTPNWTLVIREVQNSYHADTPNYEELIDGMDDFLDEILKNQSQATVL